MKLTCVYPCMLLFSFCKLLVRSLSPSRTWLVLQTTAAGQTCACWAVTRWWDRVIFFVTPLHFAHEIVQKAALWTEARTVVSGWASSLLWWLICCWWEHSLEEQVKKQGGCLKYAISFQERALTVECSIQRWPDTPLWCTKVSKALNIWFKGLKFEHRLDTFFYRIGINVLHVLI